MKIKPGCTCEMPEEIRKLRRDRITAKERYFYEREGESPRCPFCNSNRTRGRIVGLDHTGNEHYCYNCRRSFLEGETEV